MADDDGSPAARAAALRVAGRMDDAIEVLAEAHIADPDDTRIACLLADSLRVRADAGDRDVVFSLLNRTIANDPASDWPHRIASTALLERGVAAGAVAAARRALALRPNGFAARQCLIMALLRGGRAEDAADLAEAFVAENPLVPVAWQLVAAARRRLGDIPGAEDAIKRALQIAPDSAALTRDLAALRLADGDAAAAGAMYLQAQRVDPTSQAGIHGLNRAVLKPFAGLDRAWSTISATAGLLLNVVPTVGLGVGVVVLALIGAVVTESVARQAVARDPNASEARRLARSIRRPRGARPWWWSFGSLAAGVAVLVLRSATRDPELQSMPIYLLPTFIFGVLLIGCIDQWRRAAMRKYRAKAPKPVAAPRPAPRAAVDADGWARWTADVPPLGEGGYGLGIPSRGVLRRKRG